MTGRWIVAILIFVVFLALIGIVASQLHGLVMFAYWPICWLSGSKVGTLLAKFLFEKRDAEER